MKIGNEEITCGTMDFQDAVKFVLDHETELNVDGSVKVEHDPHDPGGTTKYGIDQRSHPHVDVAHLTLDGAIRIYHDEEWTKCRCENLKYPWGLAVFDTAVNIGMSRAIRMLQQVIGATVDGFIGPKTIAAANAAALDAVGEYLDVREAYYRALPLTLRGRYLKGWLARVDDLRTAAMGKFNVAEAVA